MDGYRRRDQVTTGNDCQWSHSLPQMPIAPCSARSFILRHDLPPTYRDQIVQYILQNTGAAASVPTDEAFNPDPFTGGGAYVPGQATSFPQPGVGQSSTTVTGGGVDPFTGGLSAHCTPNNLAIK